MTFSLQNTAQSLADYLAPHFPGVSFYEDPNQQGGRPPMMFLQQRYARIALTPSGRYLRTVGLDLTYLADCNRPDLQRVYQQAAEVLDENLETFPYSDGENTGLVRTYDRDWRIDLDALHYKFELRVFVVPEDTGTPMEDIEKLKIRIAGRPRGFCTIKR